jgi:GH18 family chitinase
MSGIPDETEVVNQFISLKESNPGLSAFLSIAGWSFNDGDTASYWSDMASTKEGRACWAKSILAELELYGFDGVDLDWEYPVADDRGGRDEDKEHYVSLIAELRDVLDGSGKEYGISFTTPSSYWYLQNFDITGLLDAGADWTNIMTYDLHGGWDGKDP